MPTGIPAEILTAAEATSERADWKIIAKEARARFVHDGTLTDCGSGTYFYAVAWGGFRGHMGQWCAIVRGQTKIEDHVQRDDPDPATEVADTPPTPAAPPRARKSRARTTPEPAPSPEPELEEWLRG